jgi:hypothetical protein
MVNLKAFAILVLVVVGVFVVILSSLAASDESDQYSSLEGIERIDILIDDEAVDPVEADLSGDHLPLMVRWSNWRPEFGPAFVYARERDLDGMLELNAPVEKMLMVTSIDEVQRMLRQSDQLKAAGVTTIGFNSENGTGMTPAAEMQTLNSSDPAVNVIARAAEIATAEGFKFMWGPVRRTVDALSDEAIRTMIGSGVNGLAIQEQKFIENQDANIRLSAVLNTRERYLRLASAEGVDDFTFHVQIMHQRCPNLPNCVTFVEGLESIPVDSIAIWSNGPIPVDFVNAIRME